MYGLVRSLDNSLMVVCGGEVVVAVSRNVVAVDDVAIAVDVALVDGVAVAVGATAVPVVWVQRCWMRPCTSPQSHLESVVVILRGKDPSWWYR